MLLGSVFLVVTSEDFNNPEEIDTLVSTLKDNHATVIIKEEFDNEVNYLHDSQESPLISHIITNSVQFIEYQSARSSMIPITTPQWVYDSLKSERNLNPKTYNPDPKYFLKDCFVCVADNLPVGDKEAIYGGVRAFGGSYLDVLTKYTTHLISVDLTNEKSIIASSAINNLNILDGESKIDIKVVLPHWIDHCLTLGRKLDETPYLLPDPPLLQSQHVESFLSPDINLMTSQDDLSTQSAAFKADFFNSKTFYIASDYNLSGRLTASLQKMIERNGGKVALHFDDPSAIDIYIGKYRSGDAYRESCNSNRIIVGNLHWLYSVIVSNKWVLPTNSNILHYPSPNKPLDAFVDLNISVTNYSGDARTYLSKLITIMGGKFTKTLTKDNQYLLAAKAEGKKYDTAAKRWLDSEGKPLIKIVNHLWLEECYAKWQLLDHDQPKYKFLGHGHEGVEMLLGRTKLAESDLEAWYKPNATVSSSVLRESSRDIDDSMSEDESTQSKQQPVIPEKAKSKVEDAFPQRYGSRNAAKKAAMKLHDNMSDLNSYQEISKSSRKMKTYMEELERQTTTPKRASEENGLEAEGVSTKKGKKSNEQEDVSSEAKSKEPKIAKSKESTTKGQAKEPKAAKSTEPGVGGASASSDAPTIIAMITGCESEFTLSKRDVAKFSQVGIKILSDFSLKYPCNTLIAPKILRTEKFLRCLHRVDKVVHPNYVTDVLKKLNSADSTREEVFLEFNIDDYSLDKVLPVKEINAELGSTGKGNALQSLLNSPLKGVLFNGVNLNLSANLNGGADIIAQILEDHGMQKHEVVKLTVTPANLQKQLLVSTSFKKGKDLTILVCHKSKDTKLITNFKKVVKENEINAVVVEWAWCVKSIFKMSLQPFEEFKL